MNVKKVLMGGGATLLLLFVAVQFVPVDRTNPPVTTRARVPSDVDPLLRRACFDCHSNETKWPWYSRVAPVSWLVADHVKDGRKNLNFSTWPVLDPGAESHLLHEIEEVIEEGEMPLKSYLLGHPEARLSDAEKNMILRWAGSGD